MLQVIGTTAAALVSAYTATAAVLVGGNELNAHW